MDASIDYRVYELPDIQLACWESPVAGEPLLLLHGLGDCGLVWKSLMAHLGDRYHAIAPDLRGHGNSSKPASGYGCETIIADLNALCDRLGWTSAHVLGHSWSAKVAAVWARQQPDRIRSLMLVDPFFIDRFPDWTKLTFPLLYRTLPFLKMMGPFITLEAAEQQAQQLKQYRGWSQLQQAVFQYNLEQTSDGTWGSKFIAAARDGIFADCLYISGLTEKIAIPALFVQPDQGLNRTAWQLRPYRRYLKNLQIVRVAGNHWCFLGEPDTFNQAIADFLNLQSQINLVSSG